MTDLDMSREAISERLSRFTNEDLLDAYDHMLWRFEYDQAAEIEDAMWRLIEEMTARRVVFW